MRVERKSFEGRDVRYACGVLILTAGNEHEAEGLAAIAAAVLASRVDKGERCDHPWHDNPGLITPCPSCGEGEATTLAEEWETPHAPSTD